MKTKKWLIASVASVVVASTVSVVSLGLFSGPAGGSAITPMITVADNASARGDGGILHLHCHGRPGSRWDADGHGDVGGRGAEHGHLRDINPSTRSDLRDLLRRPLRAPTSATATYSGDINYDGSVRVRTRPQS